jgi:hypothetical protein
MIVNRNIVARDDPRQLVAREGFAVDIDRGIVRSHDACPDRGKLVVAVYENRSHNDRSQACFAEQGIKWMSASVDGSSGADYMHRLRNIM